MLRQQPEKLRFRSPMKRREALTMTQPGRLGLAIALLLLLLTNLAAQARPGDVAGRADAAMRKKKKKK
jgi:hypothetical protein